MLNSAYDTYQLENILQIDCRAPLCWPRQILMVDKYAQVRHYYNPAQVQ